MVHVAIAGSGDMARYLAEEMTKVGHKVLILSRSHKPHFDKFENVTQSITDYSVESLTNALGQYEVLISTILDSSEGYIHVHNALIEACKQSPKCKRFVPSEFGGNIEEHPTQPGFYYRSREPIRNVLREQSDLEWTLVCVGWLVDYVVPSHNRYFKDIGEAFPVDLAGGRILIPGSGNDPLDVTWGRDVAKGLAQLVNAPTWEEYTYISGEQTTWNSISNIAKSRYPHLKVEYLSKDQIEEVLEKSQEEEAKTLAEYQLFSISSAGALSKSKVLSHKQKYFNDIHIRTIQEGLKDLDQDPNVIV